MPTNEPNLNNDEDINKKINEFADQKFKELDKKLDISPQNSPSSNEDQNKDTSIDDQKNNLIKANEIITELKLIETKLDETHKISFNAIKKNYEDACNEYRNKKNKPLESDGINGKFVEIKTQIDKLTSDSLETQLPDLIKQIKDNQRNLTELSLEFKHTEENKNKLIESQKILDEYLNILNSKNISNKIFNLINPSSQLNLNFDINSGTSDSDFNFERLKKVVERHNGDFPLETVLFESYPNDNKCSLSSSSPIGLAKMAAEAVNIFPNAKINLNVKDDSEAKLFLNTYLTTILVKNQNLNPKELEEKIKQALDNIKTLKINNIETLDLDLKAIKDDALKKISHKFVASSENAADSEIPVAPSLAPSAEVKRKGPITSENFKKDIINKVLKRDNEPKVDEFKKNIEAIEKNRENHLNFNYLQEILEKKNKELKNQPPPMLSQIQKLAREGKTPSDELNAEIEVLKNSQNKISKEIDEYDENKKKKNPLKIEVRFIQRVTYLSLVTDL
ncbi:MAG: hypothetical protein JWM09_1214 [Francisellaceae bacterium]|nr:hypothetical protein [Francisellaceae bacterium]